MPLYTIYTINQCFSTFYVLIPLSCRQCAVPGCRTTLWGFGWIRCLPDITRSKKYLGVFRFVFFSGQQLLWFLKSESNLGAVCVIVDQCFSLSAASGTLTAVMGKRFYNSRKIIPAGLIAGARYLTHITLHLSNTGITKVFVSQTPLRFFFYCVFIIKLFILYFYIFKIQWIISASLLRQGPHERIIVWKILV